MREAGAEEDDGRLVQDLSTELLPGGVPPIRQIAEAGRRERRSAGSLGAIKEAPRNGMRFLGAFRAS